MAYQVKIMRLEGKQPSLSQVGRVIDLLREHIRHEDRFTFDVEGPFETYLGPKTGSRQRGIAFNIRKVRLTKAKPYCGQHPGECFVGPFGARKKRNSKCLEWDDWIAFHNRVNTVLDMVLAFADVSTKPLETKGIMWIRKGLRSRIRWDWTEVQHPTRNWTIAPLRVWNLGTDDQFGEPIKETDS